MEDLTYVDFYHSLRKDNLNSTHEVLEHNCIQPLYMCLALNQHRDLNRPPYFAALFTALSITTHINEFLTRYLRIKPNLKVIFDGFF